MERGPGIALQAMQEKKALSSRATGISWSPLSGLKGVKPPVVVAQSCPTLYDPMDCSWPRSSVHGMNAGVGSHSLLQGIFPPQGPKPGSACWALSTACTVLCRAVADPLPDSGDPWRLCCRVLRDPPYPPPREGLADAREARFSVCNAEPSSFIPQHAL